MDYGIRPGYLPQLSGDRGEQRFDSLHSNSIIMHFILLFVLRSLVLATELPSSNLPRKTLLSAAVNFSFCKRVVKEKARAMWYAGL